MIVYENNKPISHTPNINQYPEALSGSWSWFTQVEDHPILAGISSLYFNNKYPSGSLIVSNYIIDEYPDLYATWNKDYMTNKFFVSPKLRKNGMAKSALIVGDQFIKFLGHELRYSFGEHEHGDFIFNGAYSLNKETQNKKINDFDMFDFRDPAYPIVHFDKRFIRYEI